MLLPKKGSKNILFLSTQKLDDLEKMGQLWDN